MELDSEKNSPQTLAGMEPAAESRQSLGAIMQDSDEMQFSNRWTKKLLQLGVESRGILPVPPEQRTDKQFNKIFFIWFSMNLNILAFSSGTLGPVIFGLGLRDSCLVILFFNILCAAPPAYLSTWGPKLGLRQMCQARYSFGFFGVIIPCLLNLIAISGFCILNCILGGQTLASVSNGHLSWSVGIVIIAIISLVVSFCGYKVLNWFERVAWFPVLLAYLVALGVSGKHLSYPPSEPATAAGILSFASTIAGFTLTYAPLGSDFTTYYHPSVSSWRIFTYSMLGLVLPIVSSQILGAACAISAPLNPSWESGYTGGNVGGLLSAILAPAGTFGKILVVLLALNVTANNGGALYSATLNFQTAIPWLVMLPRYAMAIIATALIIPISLVGAHKFYDALTNFLSVLGYWAAMFCAVVMVEHVVFHHGLFASYDLRYWNSPRQLPTGVSALITCILACGLVVPSMNQTWWVGPIGKKAGDIAFELAFFGAGLIYMGVRKVELLIIGRKFESKGKTEM